MNPIQFSTIEEANRMKSLFGQLGLGAAVFIPTYAMGGATPKLDDTHLMHMLQFGNGFVSNCGLLLHNIDLLGGAGAAFDHLKAEMDERKLMTGWWAQRPV